MKFHFAAPFTLLLQVRGRSVGAFSSSRSINYFRFGLTSTSSASAAANFFALNTPPRGGSFHDVNNDRKTTNLQASTAKDESSSTSTGTKDDTSDDEGYEIRQAIHSAALSAIDITGPSLQISKFTPDLPYVNTSKLNTRNQPKQHRVLFVLGGPGAGKGTQSAKIVDEYKCIHLSVGELLREERQKGDDSPHAELIEKCLVGGQIVPVEISLSLVRKAMDEACTSDAVAGEGKIEKKYGQRIFLVDGFPRNFDNLSGWTSAMPEHAACIGALVYDCPISVLEERILSRSETSGRSDDNLASARKRFATFQGQTMPVVYALEEVQKLQGEGTISKLRIEHIAGNASIEDVWQETKRAMDEYVKNDVLTANFLLLEAIHNEDIEEYSALCSDKLTQGDVEEKDASYKEIDEENKKSRLKRIFEKYEKIGISGKVSPKPTISNSISNAEVRVLDGTKAVVSYDRRFMNGDEESVQRETRVWSHEERGWTCVHFVRKPLD